MASDDPNEVASHCPSCKAEYRAGFDTCSDCGVALAPGPVPLEQEPERKDAWAEANERVWSGTRRDGDEEHPEPVELCRLPWDQAHMLAGRLREEGIEADVTEGSFPGVIAVVAIPEFNWARVWVRKHQLEEARRVAKDVLEGRASI